ncbi:MAG: hypothetical protein R3C11_08970 [Planctomycetaceae bacterium]
MIRKPPAWKWYSGRLFSYIAPQTLFSTEIKPDEGTSNPAAVAQREFSPLRSEFISAGLFFECQRACIDVSGSNSIRLKFPPCSTRLKDDALVNAESSMRIQLNYGRFALLPAQETFPVINMNCSTKQTGKKPADSILNWIEETPLPMTATASGTAQLTHPKVARLKTQRAHPG